LLHEFLSGSVQFFRINGSSTESPVEFDADPLAVRPGHAPLELTDSDDADGHGRSFRREA
jgi:hypothetical protein